MLKPQDIDVVILCGGLGKRLRRIVKDRPKPMAQIDQHLFLDILIKYIYKFGFRHFILCVGYMADKIKKYYIPKRHVDIMFSEEKTLLGTGGAIKKARPLIKGNLFLIINGDSFCRVNLREFLKFHIRKNALISIVLAKNKQNKDYGCVRLCDSGRISNFSEKVECKNSDLVSAGIYLCQNKIFSLLPKRKKFSLEYVLFPKLVGQRFYGYLTNNVLIDIGTPQGLRQAKAYFKRFKF